MLFAMWENTKDLLVDYCKFKDGLRQGSRPTYADIRELNKLKHDGYAEVIMEESEELKEHLLRKIKEIKRA